MYRRTGAYDGGVAAVARRPDGARRAKARPAAVPKHVGQALGLRLLRMLDLLAQLHRGTAQQLGQATLQAGGVTRLLPLTGLTTPFMSQGGSSLICNWIVIGLLLVVSHQARKPVATVTPLDPDAETTQLVRAPALSGGGPA